jgi:hypothetical protein
MLTLLFFIGVTFLAMTIFIFSIMFYLVRMISSAVTAMLGIDSRPNDRDAPTPCQNPRCQRTNASGAKFCGRCGAVIPMRDAPSRPSAYRRADRFA